MKRYWYAAALAMGLVFMCCSCGGKGGKNDDATPTETELTDVSDAEITETETDTYDEEADGDPKIKAASVDHMKMVIDSRGNAVGRYVRTNRDLQCQKRPRRAFHPSDARQYPNPTDLGIARHHADFLRQGQNSRNLSLLGQDPRLVQNPRERQGGLCAPRPCGMGRDGFLLNHAQSSNPPQIIKPVTNKSMMQKPMMSLALNLAMAKAGKAQKG